MPTVDSLDILVKAQADSASQSLERLVNMFNQIRISVSSISDAGGGLSQLSSGIRNFVDAAKGLQNLKTADFTRLTKNITNLGNIDSASISKASETLYKMVNALDAIGNVGVSDGAKQLSELAKGISSLGYKSSTKAIENIPKLANAMKDLMSTLSNAPRVNQNLIDMTNALANLARTGASSGRAANSLSRSLNTYNSSTGKASRGTFSLASAIGKLYATYWLLFRAFRTLGKAIDISSQLTEVQNVVDVTFGEYSSLIEKMSQTSITDFGMSELTVKQVSSRFQAMGAAMGFTQGKMADMSVELTKLTADMASFYNVEQADVAEDLASIFTGQTRPLRQYGLDLTEATLKEYALRNGLNANISAMTQAEKAMLRYQYVMANTGAAQGDFARTSGTWANQIRILKMNFQELGSVVGGTLINAFKPLVTALNYVIGKLISFAKVVSDSLGKIFGWEYQASGSGGVVNDFEDLADSSDDLASGTGGASKNLGSAADNAKKLKDYLLGIDELNVISPDDSSGGGGSGGSGGGSGGGGGGSSTDTGGQWTKTESLWEKYESDLDTLYKLGDYIGTKLTDAMNSIDWNKVYEGAKNFGTGLAEFLNGLISPELFSAVGSTIAGALNTAIYAVLSLGEEFDFYEFGYSIAQGLSKFFQDFDFGALAETLNTWVDGLVSFIAGFLSGLTWGDILSAIPEFLGDLELDTIGIIAAGVALKNGKKLKSKIIDALSPYLTIKNLAIAVGIVTISIAAYEFLMDKEKISEFGSTIVSAIFALPEDIVYQYSYKYGRGLLGLIMGDFSLDDATSDISTWAGSIEKFLEKNGKYLTISIVTEKFVSIVKEKWDEVVEYWEDKDILEEVKTTYEDIKSKVKEKWDATIQYWGIKEKLKEVKTTYEDFKAKVKEKWNKTVEYWEDKDILEEVKTTYESFVDKISGLWDEAVLWWKNNAKLPKLDINFDFSTSSIRKAINSVITFINTHIIDALNKISIKIPTLNLGPLGVHGGQTIGFNLSHIGMFEDGGFPSKADLFWANENGVPELVGTMGGKPAVASGTEITGISDAVYSVGQTEAALLTTAISLLQEIASKETIVNVSDKQIARSNIRGKRTMGLQLIKEI